MELGIRDWFLVIGGLMIAAVLGHGAWLYFKSRRSAVRIRYEKNIPDIDIDDIDLLRAELPSGGARVVGRGETGGAGSTASDDQSVPVLLDPIDQDVQQEAPPAPPPALPSAGDEPATAVPPRPARPRRQRPVEPDGAPSATPEAEGGGAEEDARQAPLFANEPIVPRERGDSGRGRRRGADPGRKPPREEPAPPVAEAEAEPEEGFEEVLVVNVLARQGAFPGPQLLDTITRRGMRYGDMNIFHRFGSGSRRRAEFSMASAVEPGTFDLAAIDEYSTPGVTFFMQLPGPAEPLEAFEDMVSIARDVAAELGGDLKDEQHSVMTAQTIEHCRQRIRDFTRRQMSRRA